MAFHFMFDLLSCMNDEDKQQVCNDISTSWGSFSVWEQFLWEFYKITMC